MVVGLHPGVVLLGQKGAHERAGRGIVHIEMHMVLRAVEDLDEDIPVVRAPADVGEVPLVVEIRDLHIDGRPLLRVIDSQSDVFGCHSVHRVLEGHELARTGLDVQDGEIGHPRLVLAVEGDLPPGGRPVDAFAYAELVAADGLAVGDLVAGVLGNGQSPAVCRDAVQAAAFGEGIRAVAAGRHVACPAGDGPSGLVPRGLIAGDLSGYRGHLGAFGITEEIGPRILPLRGEGCGVSGA